MHELYQKVKSTKLVRRLIEWDVRLSDMLEGRFRRYKKFHKVLFKIDDTYPLLAFVVAYRLVAAFGVVRLLDVVALLLTMWALEKKVKPFFRRFRPYFLDGALPVNHTGNFSFPSTHSFIAGWIVSYWCGLGLPLWPAVAVMGAVVAVSRVVLNVHFLSDVMVGFLLGLLYGVIAI